MSKREVKRNVPPGKQAGPPPPQCRRTEVMSVGSFPPLLLLAAERLKQGGDSQLWAETMLDLWPPASLSRKTGTSPYVSVFRALNRTGRFRCFRLLCEAGGFGPCEEFGKDEDGGGGVVAERPADAPAFS